MASREICVFEDNQEINAYLKELLKKLSKQAIKERGLFSMALSGGVTPEKFYRSLADTSDFLPWDDIHLFMVDERYVKPGDNDHNFSMVQRTILSSIKLPKKNLHPIQTDLTSIQETATSYEKELKRFFYEDGHSKSPIFDFILLGIGQDGHTASLFPGSPALEEKEKLVAISRSEHARHERITLTLPIINLARTVVFLITGPEKKNIVQQIVQDKIGLFPASKVNPENGKLYFILDSGSCGDGSYCVPS